MVMTAGGAGGERSGVRARDMGADASSFWQLLPPPSRYGRGPMVDLLHLRDERRVRLNVNGAASDNGHWHSGASMPKSCGARLEGTAAIRAMSSRIAVSPAAALGGRRAARIPCVPATVRRLHPSRDTIPEE